MHIAGSDSCAGLFAVRKRYGTITALDGVDLDVRVRRAAWRLLGPNGAGKSTAIGLLLGLSDPDAGRSRACSANRRTNSKRAADVGVMLQSAGMPDTLKVRELLAQTRSYYPRSARHRRMCGDGRHRRSARPPLRQVVRRATAARAVRARDLRAPETSVSRRAHRRPRRRGAPVVVEHDARSRRRRMRGAADYALSRRSRGARRSRRRARPRSHHRRRQRARDPRARRAASHPLRVAHWRRRRSARGPTCAASAAMATGSKS